VIKSHARGGLRWRRRRYGRQVSACSTQEAAAAGSEVASGRRRSRLGRNNGSAR
jgi:hypothetical protein